MSFNPVYYKILTFFAPYLEVFYLLYFITKLIINTLNMQNYPEIEFFRKLLPFEGKGIVVVDLKTWSLRSTNSRRWPPMVLGGHLQAD
jgi:hypothetical protein